MPDFPIHRAAATGNAVELRRRIEEGADVDTLGYEQATPLIYAVSNCNKECVLLLLENGADPSYQTEEDGRSAMDSAIFHEVDPSFVSLLVRYGARSPVSGFVTSKWARISYRNLFLYYHLRSLVILCSHFRGHREAFYKLRPYLV